MESSMPELTELIERIRKTAEELRACPPPAPEVKTLDSEKVLDFLTFFGGLHG